MLLTCPDEAYQYVGTAIFDALTAPGPRARMTAGPLRLRVGLIDPDCVLYIDVDRRELRFGSWTDDGGTALIAMRGDAAVLYCQGRLDMEVAVDVGEVAVDGDWREFVHRLTDSSSVVQAFEAAVRREGRADLLPEPVAC